MGRWDIPAEGVREGNRGIKRDSGDEHSPVVLPEVEPEVRDSIAQSAVEGLVTEPMLSIEIGGEEFCSW